jgi:hypothetical protein
VGRFVQLYGSSAAACTRWIKSIKPTVRLAQGVQFGSLSSVAVSQRLARAGCRIVRERVDGVRPGGNAPALGRPRGAAPITELFRRDD